MRLFHVSDDASIDVFHPRPLPQPKDGAPKAAVWAIDEDHLANYLLPRDCPRVTFRATSQTLQEDIIRFFGDLPMRRMVITEEGWAERILSTTVHVYELPPASFRLLDANAGYYLAEEPVTPLARRAVASLPDEITRHDCAFHFVPDLWPIHDSVVNSTMAYSIIRMRNAQPRR